MIDHVLGLQNLAPARAALLASAKKGDRSAVASVEAAVRSGSAGVIQLDDRGFATISARGRTYAGGRFEVVALGELAARVKAQARSGGAAPRFRLSVLSGADPITDIGSLQATADQDTLFQVASQFNCLEAPGQRLTSVASYFNDPTQGPRASISAFPGTIVRHYAAPRADGRRFVQTDTDQLDLLEHLCPPSVATVRHGYLTSADISDPHALAAALDANFYKIQVGVHEDVEVALGYNWDGLVEDPGKRRISQVFTSTFAGGGYSEPGDLGGQREAICRQLLRAAYLGTLLAAAALGKRTAVLTLIGGGVFDNPKSLIWGAIDWAINEVEAIAPASMDVVVNAWGGLDGVRAEVLARVTERGGVLCELEAGLARLTASLEGARPIPSPPRTSARASRTVASPQASSAPEPIDAHASLLARVKAAGGKVVDDAEGRGRLVIKLPLAETSLANQLQAETSCELRRGFKHLVLMIAPHATRSASPRLTPGVPEAEKRPAPTPAARGDEVWVAVADLHGHRGHLAALLGFLDRELGATYRLCTLGDYVDNGDEIPGLLDDLIALKTARGDRFVPILGNHDLALLRALGWPGREPDEEWFAHWSHGYWNGDLGTPAVYARGRGVATPRSAASFAALLPADHAHRVFLQGLPWFHDTGEYLFVHAGMFEGPLEPQRQALAARTLPPKHLHLPQQVREKELSKVADPGWDRVVVSAHNKRLGGPRFEGPNRVCLSGEVDATDTLYAVVLLPERLWLRVGPDLKVRAM
jgi:hypothetical protein